MNLPHKSGVFSSTKSWVVVAGPTASGKSALGMALARELNGEIVSCDSVQVYRGFDIGSAKPSQADLDEVPHHMIDVATWRDDFDAGTYGTLGRQAIAAIMARGRVPIVVGGSGLYLRALFGQAWHGDLPKDEALRGQLEMQDSATLYQKLQSIDPVRAAEIHQNDRFRVIRALEIVTLLGRPLRSLQSDTSEITSAAYVVVLDPQRTALHEAIADRTTAMINGGLMAETERLRAEGCPPEAKPMMSIGYRQAAGVLAGSGRESDLVQLINAATRQYAKRQTTWFKSVVADERLTGQPGAFALRDASGLAQRIRHSLNLSTATKS